jgi:hypothetical protein
MHFRNLNLTAPVYFLTLICACCFFLSGEIPVAEAQCCIPSFENQIETEHFVLSWTNASSHEADNINDPQVVKETAGYLETAWEKLSRLFGRAPYVPPGSSKVAVIFHDLDCYAYADPPEGPIELNSRVWMKMPSIRQSTSAHELFHKLQYAYGYKTRWRPGEPILWFTEGTAAWAEVFVWGRVTRDCKMENMFTNTGIDLFDAEDMALPFWIFFVSGNSVAPRDQLMVELFERCEEKKWDVKKALFDVIRDAYGSADSFFFRFALARRSCFWRDPGAQSTIYTQILGPGNKDLVAEIKEYQRLRTSAAGALN